MSERYKSIIEEIKQEFARPKDLKNEELIFGPNVVPVLFTEITFAEEEAYASKMLHVGPVSKFFPKPNFKFSEENDIIWNLDESKKSTFNEEGKFVLEESFHEPSSTLWFFLLRKDHVHGPFTSAEMREKAKNNELEDAMIKRNNDIVCVSFKKLKSLCPDLFDDEKGVEAIFLEEKHMAELQKHNQKELSGTDKRERLEERLPKGAVTDILGKCTKSRDFLTRRKSKASIAEVGIKLEGQDKNTCIKVISEVTGMSKSDCETFLDIFIEESKLPICCNVDKEGFEALVTKNQRSSNARGFC